MRKYEVLAFAALLVGLLLVGCGEALPEASSLPTPTTEPDPQTPREAIELIVLHTNDNWGETEPCG